MDNLLKSNDIESFLFIIVFYQLAYTAWTKGLSVVRKGCKFFSLRALEGKVKKLPAS